jgi:uncharacterized membrane protein YbhN (UPF0104 family)
MNQLNENRAKGTFGWPVRLLLLLLILALVGSAGPSEWRMLFKPKSLIVMVITMAVFLVWHLFDKRSRRRN